MNHNSLTMSIPVTDTETTVEFSDFPWMPAVMVKALFAAMARPGVPEPGGRLFNTSVQRACFKLNSQLPDREKINRFHTVCSSPDVSEPMPETIPIAYFQSLFVTLLGKYIASEYFPISPLGLIHVFQSFEMKRAVNFTEALDLSCRLSEMTLTPKGIESSFLLKVTSGGEEVWRGVSVFLTRAKTKKEKKRSKTDDTFLDKQETIEVPAGIGRQYAQVSGDYNPHHLYSILAKLFGFKRAIAHGMWSLARTASSLDARYNLSEGPAYLETFFKRPIFMPATLSLGVEDSSESASEQEIFRFELRDQKSGIPHLKGYFTKQPTEQTGTR